MALGSPLCLRLTPDLHAAVESAAATANVSVSEWIRNMLWHFVYAEPPGPDEGYERGRAMGFRAVQLALQELHGKMPQDVTECAAYLSAMGSRLASRGG